MWVGGWNGYVLKSCNVTRGAFSRYTLLLMSELVSEIHTATHVSLSDKLYHKVIIGLESKKGCRKLGHTARAGVQDCFQTGLGSVPNQIPAHCTWDPVRLAHP